MPTSDGIERVTGLESLSTPDGGEGGSVPQALGSKAEERAKRRKKKKDSYAKYLESTTWRKIRARALTRDKHTCRACKGKASVVHHIRYPKNLGDEKMEWLYSLCKPCHNAIHRSAKTMTLRKATELILASPAGTSNVIHLPPARRNKKRKQPPRPKKVRKITFEKRGHKKSKLELENERLRQIFKENAERRERRWGA